MSPTFMKAYLDLKDKEGFCHDTGYTYILEDLKYEVQSSGKQQAISLDSYLKSPKTGDCLEKVFKKNRHKRVANWFIRHVAGHDGNYRDLSAFDLEYAQFHLYGKQWKENWVLKFFSSFHQTSIIQRIRDYGTILLNPHSAKKTQKTHQGTPDRPGDPYQDEWLR